MQVEKVLERLGFRPNEIKTYLALNDHGSQKAGKIAKIAQIDRSSCYNALRLLQQRGLVSYAVIGTVKWFQAAGPKRLLEYLHEQEDDVLSVLPELTQRHKAAKIEGQVRLFKGLKGVRTIFMDIIRTGKDNYVFGSEGQLSERMPEFCGQFERLKRENKLHTYMIARKGREEKDNSTTTHKYLSRVKGSPAITNIYGDKVALIIWTDTPEGIIIENAAAAKSYKSYFDVLWELAEKARK